jgi:hypothetical protein
MPILYIAVPREVNHNNRAWIYSDGVFQFRFELGEFISRHIDLRVVSHKPKPAMFQHGCEFNGIGLPAFQRGK